MADGDYERRGGREAELKRFVRLLAEAKESRRATPLPTEGGVRGADVPGGHAAE